MLAPESGCLRQVAINCIVNITRMITITVTITILDDLVHAVVYYHLLPGSRIAVRLSTAHPSHMSRSTLCRWTNH